MTVLSIDRLCKTYPAFQLSEVSFSLEQGRIMGFIGRNGAGKTTTLKSLLNMVHPDSGDIVFFGKRFADSEPEIKQRTGFVSGGVDFYIHKKLRTITAVTKRFYPAWDDAAYARYRDMFSLDENKTPDQLSAGMKVKYSLLLALSHKAELLILDEPTSGLDPVSRDDLLDVFLTLADEGITILFSTHITSDLDKCADDITYIQKGRILTSTTLDEFRGRYLITDELTPEQLTDAIKPKLIGCKRSKHGFTALCTPTDAQALGIAASPADLEDIMVHLEAVEGGAF